MKLRFLLATIKKLNTLTLPFCILVFALFFLGACGQDEPPQPEPDLAQAGLSPTTAPTATSDPQTTGEPAQSPPPADPVSSPTPPVQTPSLPAAAAVEAGPPELLTQINLPLGEERLIAAELDPYQRKLYLLQQNQGRLFILNLDDYEDIQTIETAVAGQDSYYVDTGYLALDPLRQRLYISGDPVRVLDTQSLKVESLPDLAGHISLDLQNNRLYFTPQCNCRLDICDTLMLDGDSLEVEGRLFPDNSNALTAHCVYQSKFDPQSQLLYTHINNGVPGSNSGSYFFVFDTQQNPPEAIYQEFDISFGYPLWQAGQLFVNQYRSGHGRLFHLDLNQAGTAPEILEGIYGETRYDAANERLYVLRQGLLQVFDHSLTLLAHLNLPIQTKLLALDQVNQVLFIGSREGISVLKTGGGNFSLPSFATSAGGSPAQAKVYAAADTSLFRQEEDQFQRSDDDGQSWTQIGWGLPAQSIRTLAISPNFAQDQKLWLALGDFNRGFGLYRSDDGGQSWTPSMRGLRDFQISDIIPSPSFERDQTVFVGTLNQGLYRSDDGGQSWTNLSHTYATENGPLAVAHLTLSPNFADDQRLFLSQDRLLRSEDGGQTWEDTTIPAGAVAFSPQNPNLIISSAGWRSEDGGESWQAAALGWGYTPHQAESVFFTADNHAYLFTPRRHNAPAQLQRSLDGGQSWQYLLSPFPGGFQPADVNPLADSHLRFMPTESQDDPPSFLDVDPATLSWGQTSPDLSQIDLQALLLTPQDVLFVANNAAGVYKSLDQGQTWLESNFPARSQDASIARLAADLNGNIYAVIGGKLYRSFDEGLAWQAINTLPPDLFISALAVSESGVILLGGDYRQNDLWRSRDSGQTWNLVFENTLTSASEVAAITFAGERAYAWLQYGGLLASQDQGQSWRLILEDQNSFVQTMLVGPDQRLWLGVLGGQVLVSADQGQSFVDLGAAIPMDRVWSSAFAFDQQGGVFVGTDIGLFKGDTEGRNWQALNQGLALDPVTGQAQAVRDLQFLEDRFYAALTSGGVYVSFDRGKSWYPSTAVSSENNAGLSNVDSNTEAIHCATPSDYFSALDTSILGCPTPPGDTYMVSMVEQYFEGGLMIWRSDRKEIYSLSDEGQLINYLDLWDESKARYSCPEFAPSETPPTPERGFGLIWCEDLDLRSRLGQAITPERAFEARIQDFDTGFVFENDLGEAYLINLPLGLWFPGE